MIVEDVIQRAANDNTLAEGDELVKFKIEWREDGKDAQPQYWYAMTVSLDLRVQDKRTQSPFLHIAD
jgi:hypothetical protein